MEVNLFKKFYQMFLIEGLLLLFTSVGFLVLGIVCWIHYGSEGTKLWSAIFCSCGALILISITIKALLPFFKDLPYIRRKEIKVIEGVVEGYKTVKANGDPPTVDYYPIIKAEGDHEIKVILSVDAQLGVKYKFAYLPNTKLAVILKEYT